MTIEEATTLAEWIQRAFPHMRMEPRFYIRALVHYEYEPAQREILKAIENDWTRLPKVAEVVEVVRSYKPPPTHCETCDDDALVFVGTDKAGGDEYAPCPDCHPLSDTNYFDKPRTASGRRALNAGEVRERMRQ